MNYEDYTDPKKYRLSSSLNEEEEMREGKTGALDEGNSQAAAMSDRYAKSGGGAQQGESGADTAGNALMMSGNPYAMAAGAALKVVSGVSKKKQAEKQAKADAENARRSTLIKALGSLGSGVGSTGMA